MSMGYENVSVMESVVQGYRDANIPLEYELYRNFKNDANTFPVDGIQGFIANLYVNGQHYVPIVDSNIYVPNPNNESDAYTPFNWGAALGTYIRDSTTGNFYYGDNWPGFSVWADWLELAGLSDQRDRDVAQPDLVRWYPD
ncbi:hypothetical protein LTR49_028850 [Elasticomyces elasticus]|nr:hypothetical protein LTR49_028850 [Elasticomyces elasticus]